MNSFPPPSSWQISARPVDGPDARTVLRAYMDELISRYHGRPAEEAEITHEMEDDADLRDGRGVLLLARAENVPVACTGIRWLEPGVAELTRVFVTPDARRGGAGRRMIAAAEETARVHGTHRMLLNTRKDLSEAVSLYTTLGYLPTDPYGDDPYAEVWFAKELG